MKRTLFLTALLSCLFSNAHAATYTNLTSSWCDEENKVIYSGNGYFAVDSDANTEVILTISLDSLTSYVNSNDYNGSSYMLLWNNDIQRYGIGDNADTTVDNGEREPYLSGYTTAAWNADSNIISYDKLSSCADSHGNITLTITNHKTQGVTVTSGTEELYKADGLKYGSMTGVTGYYVNLNYVTSVTLNTASKLDTSSYVPPVDYSLPFISQRTDGTSVGRITFLGDSITHGVNDQSYRWQFFKILTDNGIENEIVGPREGYHSTPGHTEDAGTSYGGTAFANVHLAQASGRTHNIISGSTSATVNGTAYSSGVNYGGHSTASTEEKYDSNTWFCMMGTNDLLSDTPNSGPSTTQYVEQMQKMLGGTVSYNAGNDTYTWTQGDNWGSMGTIVKNVCKGDDTFYMLSITPWGNHANHNRDMDHYAAQEFNRNLEAWTESYSAATGKNVVYVDVTRGMVDHTSSNRFMGYDGFFNNSGDRLHPNDQGSIIMAGNLAQAMGIGGRTAGLQRSGTEGWSSAAIGTVAAGSTQMVGENAFSMSDGYTIDFSADFGNGATDGWMAADNALSISLGDGTNSGTLNLSEGYISWGSEVLFCWDNSTLSNEGNLRVAWHNGNEKDNVLSGYYVWLGDMLIGQGLAASENGGLNGILISSSGANGTLKNLTWTDTAYAPTTNGLVSAENAYLTKQDAAEVGGFVANTALSNSGIDFTNATNVSIKGTQIYTQSSSPTKATLSSEGWVGLISSTDKGVDVAAQITSDNSVTHTVFGAMGGNTKAGDLTLQVDGGSIGGGMYSDQDGVKQYAAIAGSYGGGSAKSFTVYINDGTIGEEANHDIVGGAVNGSGTIEQVKIVLNDGNVKNIIGGSKTAGTVGSANIIVQGGTVNGNINAGGDAGTVGNTHVLVNGGTINGNITKGGANRTDGAIAAVTIQGNKANIGGNIAADTVTFRDVAASDSAQGFDKYSKLVTADKVTLDNVSTNMQAQLKAEEIEVLNGSITSAVLGEQATLTALTLDSNTTFTAWKDNTATAAVTQQESTLTLSKLTVGNNATLNANVVFTADSQLTMGGTLAMGSTVDLSTGMELTLSESMLAALYSGNTVDIFSGVDALFIDGKEISDGTSISADGLFNGLDESYSYTISYANGSVSLSIPEPATATLSLLALAGLAARRRRK